MDIHLHHAMTAAAHASGELSSVALWGSRSAGLEDLHNNSVRHAREYLAKAAAELNAYDAKRSFKAEAA